MCPHNGKTQLMCPECADDYEKEVKKTWRRTCAHGKLPEENCERCASGD